MLTLGCGLQTEHKHAGAVDVAAVQREVGDAGNENKSYTACGCQAAHAHYDQRPQHTANGLHQAVVFRSAIHEGAVVLLLSKYLPASSVPVNSSLSKLT